MYGRITQIVFDNIFNYGRMQYCRSNCFEIQLPTFSLRILSGEVCGRVIFKWPVKFYIRIKVQ